MGATMTDQTEQAAPGAGADPISNLQGNISMTATGGYMSTLRVGESPATVDWVQGSPPIASAQFSLAHMPRIPMPPPPLITNLSPGVNSVPAGTDWWTASVDWTYGGDSGAGTFSLNMADVPAGPGGSNLVGQIVGAQKGNFDIAFASEPTSCLLSLQITPSQAFMGPETVGVYVDGQYVGSFPDGTVVVIKGSVLTFNVDFRAESFTEIQVGYTLQYQW
jgi:hypothetical protein